MSIAEKLEKFHKNRIKNIKKMKNGTERDLAIGSLVADLGNRAINGVSKVLNISRNKVKSCYEKFVYGIQISIEFRGRKKVEVQFPNLINDIEIIIENFKNADSHFKSKLTYISIDPNSIINILIKEYNYPEKFACYNTMVRILKKQGYKYCKLQKSDIINRVPETDIIFENVNDNLEALDKNNKEVAAISIDDKATKKIGLFSDNGKTWINETALDHDTIFKYVVKPFGILDLKTNDVYVTCTTNNSTAEFKVNCIERYIIEKNKDTKLKKLIIFLDNGPENSSRRKLWLKCLKDLTIKYNLVIQLVYYPPYCSKYNKIERVWARMQLAWRKIKIDSLELLISTINKITWLGKNINSTLSTKYYEKGKKVSDYEIENEINPHIIREIELEKWSLVITPYVN